MAASEDDMDEEITDMDYSDEDEDIEEKKEVKNMKFQREKKKIAPGFIHMDNEEDLNDYFEH